MSKIEVKNLGRIEYPKALDQMMALHAARVQNQIVDQLLLLEHEPVVTVGRRLHGEKTGFEDALATRSIAICEADRGGLLTYHGPGQIVVYFILRLDDYFNGVSAFVHGVEDAIMTFLANRGCNAERDEKNPGIWVGQQKIGSVGFRVEKGVTRHGISLNVNNDLSIYNLFNPCGMTGSTMSNLEAVLQKSFSNKDFQKLSHDLGEFLAVFFAEQHVRLAG